MVEVKPKLEIKLEQIEAEGCCAPDCGPESCGSVEPTAEQEMPVVAGASGDGCCEPDCGPGTCS